MEIQQEGHNSDEQDHREAIILSAPVSNNTRRIRGKLDGTIRKARIVARENKFYQN